MSLFISAADPQRVYWAQQDLLAMIDFDMGFSSQIVGSTAGNVQIFLTSTRNSIPHQALRRLIAFGLPTTVLPLSCHDHSIAEGKTGLTISQLGGGQASAQHPDYDANGNAIITEYWIEYDATGCCSTNYYVTTQQGQKAALPPYVILMHEMGHILGIDAAQEISTEIKNLNWGYGQAAAIFTENDIRALYKCPLRATNEYAEDIGCGYNGPSCKPPDPPKAAANDPNSRCFVVLAALGSSAIPTLNRLRMLREYLLKSSQLGALFFVEFDRQYYQASNQICIAIEQNPTLRATIRRWIVQPLTAYLAAVSALLTANRMVAFPRLLCSGLPSWPSYRTRVAASLVERLVRVCAGEADAGADHGLDPLYDAFRFLKIVLQSFPRPPKILSWALLEPLEFLWRAHAEANDDPWNLLTPFVAQWLARFPVAVGYGALSLEELSEDLALLRARIFTNANLWSPLLDGIAATVADASSDRMRLVSSARRS